VDGVVVIFRIRRVDGDERQVTPILPARQADRLRGFRLGQDLAREFVRDVVRVERNEADGLLGFQRPQNLAYLRLRQAELTGPEERAGDEVSLVRAVPVGFGDGDLAALRLLVDRHDPPATRRQ
jgi:hypothetical protein